MVSACIDSLLEGLPFGTYHVTNPGVITAKEIAEIAKNTLKLDRNFDFFNTIGDFNAFMGSPRSNTSLNTDKLKNAGIKMTEVHESVEKCFKEWKW